MTAAILEVNEAICEVHLVTAVPAAIGGEKGARLNRIRDEFTAQIESLAAQALGWWGRVLG